MAFQRPSLSDLITRIQADLSTRLELDNSAVLRRSVVYVLARVEAAAVHLLYGFLSFIADQIFPDTSESEFLVRQASLYGLTRNPATYATGNIVATGTNGVVIPAGTVLQRSDGAEYTTDADATIATGTATIAVTASTAGAAGACDPSSALTFLSPLVGVNATATVDSGGLAGASDTESDDDFRLRLIARMSAPPHGGSAADYVAWAKEVTGVTRAWCYPEEGGAGTVTVRFVRDDDGTGSAIIPSSGEVAAVQAHIDAVRPVTAAVTVAAPTADTLDFTIHIVADDLTAAQAAVQAELQDLLTRTAEPGGTIPISQIRMAVGLAAGVTDFTVTLPSADVTSSTGHLKILGTITWT